MTTDDELRHGIARNVALRKTFVSSAWLQAATVLGAFFSLPFVTRALTGAEMTAVSLTAVPSFTIRATMSPPGMSNQPPSEPVASTVRPDPRPVTSRYPGIAP